MEKTIKETPVIVKINEGEIISSAANTTKKFVSVDLFNSKRENYNNYKLSWNSSEKKFTIKDLIPMDKTFTLGSSLYNGVLLLNGEDAKSKFNTDLVVGTHLGIEKPADDLLSKRHTIKCGEYSVDAKFDFVYVQMTEGVPDDFGDDEFRKSSENSTSANDIKVLCDKNNVRLGLSHYLTGHPLEDGISAEDIGKVQAHKFLKSIVGSETSVSDPTALQDGLRPIVMFMDNITQVGFYGSSPTGVKKDLETF